MNNDLNDLCNLVLAHPFKLLTGLFTTMILGILYVDKKLSNISDEFKIKESDYGVDKIIKSQSIVFNIPSVKESASLGEAERILLFFSWIILPEMIIGWFLFKVASKWELWNNVYKFPEVFSNSSKEESLSARIWLGARTYQRFLIGAILNILVSLIGFVIYIVLTAYSIKPYDVYLFIALAIFYSVIRIIKKNSF